MDANVVGLHGEQGSAAGSAGEQSEECLPETGSVEGRRRLDRLGDFMVCNGFETDKTEWTHTWRHPNGKTFYRAIDYLTAKMPE